MKINFMVGSVGDGLVLLPTIEYTNKINRVGRGIAIVWLKWVVVIRVKDKAFDVTKVINRDFDETAATLGRLVGKHHHAILMEDDVFNIIEDQPTAFDVDKVDAMLDLIGPGLKGEEARKGCFAIAMGLLRQRLNEEFSETND